ncbi:MFS general substrate transporter [Colletotrichum caudatum]|nr:MFS general substrate transporter [Colletotrichum caudatum]
MAEFGKLIQQCHHRRQTSDGRCYPRQWGRARKTYDTCLILFLEFYTYLIGQSIGGIFFPLWSESFGRKSLYIISTALYRLFCLTIGAFATITGVVMGRFATGILSSILTVVITGSIEDLWDMRARVWWVFLWVLVGNLGLLTGPMISDGILGHSRWKWVFYTAAIVTACMACLLFTIKESRLSTLMTRTSNRREKLDLLLFLVSFVTVVLFGLIYLFTEVLLMVYLTLALGASLKNAPLLAIGLGTIFSVLTRGYDVHILARLSAQDLSITLENKLAGFVVGAPLLAVSLWWFAWTILPFVVLHWVIPTASLLLTGYALNEFNYVLAGYLTDCYEQYAASSVGAMAITRSLFSVTFPLFGTVLFRSLGYNMALTVLAIAATILCVAPPLLLCYRAILREKSVLV